jgi:hypothetical protein
MQPSLVFRPADLVLTCSRGLASAANRLGQLIASGKPAQFTHVAICMAPDVLLDARPFVDIRLRNIFDELRSGRLDGARLTQPDVLVLRNPALTASHDMMDDTATELVRPLYHQLRKKYNWLFRIPQPSDNDPAATNARRAFCSELCVLMMTYLNVLPGTWTRASATFPANFQELVSSGWCDVTEDWSAELRSVQQAIDAPQSTHGQIVMQREKTANDWIKETEGWAQVQDTFSDLVNDMSAHLDDLVARAKKRPSS